MAPKGIVYSGANIPLVSLLVALETVVKRMPLPASGRSRPRCRQRAIWWGVRARAYHKGAPDFAYLLGQISYPRIVTWTRVWSYSFILTGCSVIHVSMDTQLKPSESFKH